MKEANWKDIALLIEDLEVLANAKNNLVSIGPIPSQLTCIGKGTDAAVLIHNDFPQYAFKIYAYGKEEKRRNEVKAYEKLNNHFYFPTFYGSGKRFIAISYEQGINLHDCLIKGIEIPPSVIEQVDEAIAYARQAGLNPRDIHLKNIIMQEHTIKLIDVSEYVLPGNDERWEHLKEGYRMYYPLIRHRKIPAELIEFMKAYYQKYQTAGFSKQMINQLLFLFFKKSDQHKEDAQ
ncbi:serine/threonine protein kinase [Bacillus sp. REN10]|uniref:serine/threonine protein kinase n=1 Tax=Bacillus sp. REN10 TaxID=2782541 RepID=UPI00193B9140|nr:serine/threonine protein kinase [Bacillus sp. REN10]